MATRTAAAAPFSFKYLFSRSLRRTIDAGQTSWTFYAYHVDAQPRLTAALTGATLWGIADLYVQKRIEKVEKLEMGRLYGSVAFGVLVTGFGAFYWYTFLDHLVRGRMAFKKGTLPFVATKVSLELGIFAPVSLFFFWYILGKAEQKPYREILEQLHGENKYWESLKVDWMIWLPIDALNFWLVKVRYQILVVNIACFLEAVVLGQMEAAADRREQAERKRKELENGITRP